MRFRTASVAASAFAVGLTLGAASLALAQDPRFRIFTPAPAPSTPQKPAPPSPQVTAGDAQLSLRVQGRHQGRVVGTLVAKVDGKWVEVQLAPQDALLSAR